MLLVNSSHVAATALNEDATAQFLFTVAA